MKKTIAAVVTLALSAALLSSAAFAGEEGFAKKHPRRAEVNARLNNQNKRIDKEVKEGEISKTQAAKLHKEDRQVRQEERDMASQNGGRITKSEQQVLNQQENKISQQIGK